MNGCDFASHRIDVKPGEGTDGIDAQLHHGFHDTHRTVAPEEIKYGIDFTCCCIHLLADILQYHNLCDTR
ncbi:hypothetical protein AM394_02755 [Klebsiella oxytoca]|nr:hypothetical protein AM394_02755 [Klebsiella oxytoca]